MNKRLTRSRFDADSKLGHILGGAFIAIAYGAFLAYLFINQ
jgi:flagellar motor component MotA